MVRDGAFILIWLNVILMLILTILLVYLLLRKWKEIHFRKKVETVKIKLQPIIFEFILGGPWQSVMKVKRYHEKKALEETLLKVSEVLEEESILNRVTELATKRLSTMYRKNLFSRNWSTRMNTLFMIEKLQMKEMLPDMIQLIQTKKTSSVEKNRVLQIIATMQHFETEKYIRSFALSEYAYRGILLRFEPMMFDVMMLGFHQSCRELQLAILDVIAMKSEIKHSSFVEFIFHNYKGEVKIGAYKALIALGYVKNPEQFNALATSEIWQERMLTAKWYGTIKKPSYIPNLIQLIQDPVWWVRYHAGQALAHFPEGVAALQELLNSQDSFARDMAWEWMNKGEGT